MIDNGVMQRKTGLFLLVCLFLASGFFADDVMAQVAGSDSDDYGNYGNSEMFSGFLRAQRVAVLSAEVEGLIGSIESEPQDFVSAGDVLIRLDSTLVEIAVERITAQLEMNTDIAEAETALEYAQDNLEIVQRLFETEVGGARVGSPKEMREATQRRDMARYALQEAQMNVRLLELELRQNEVLLAKHSIVAPMDGVVVPFSSLDITAYDQVKQVVVGEMVTRGQPVIALMKVDFLRISENFPPEQLANVHLGQTANIYVQGAGDEAFVGHVVYISPTIGSTGRFTVEVEFENPVLPGTGESEYRYRFRPGMSGRVELVD
ncbi:MAG: efflux RND transporter periplasmic adaptor subunit [Sedimentisphaerales bacterium]|nr:efflux RND transporter periplasmic adaptor subunit [Sedimentisphaerales bacterium]